MPQIEICPIKKLYMTASEADLSDCAAVLVSSYEIEREKLLGLNRALPLNFEDCTFGESAFCREDALLIKLFVDTLPEGIDTLFVCCDYGESRSAAMGAAILRYLGKSDIPIWENPKFHPNWLVYSVLCRELGIEVSKEELSELVTRNEEAFRKYK